MFPRLPDDAWRSPTASLPADTRSARGLVRLSHAIAGGRAHELLPRAVLDVFRADETSWSVLDHACARCACDTVLFAFVAHDGSGRSFAVRVTLADPVAELAEVPVGMDTAHAMAVWTAWLGSPRATVDHWRDVHARFRSLLVNGASRWERRGKCGCGSGRRADRCCLAPAA